MADDLEPCRLVVQHLAHVLADPVQRAAAVGAAAALRLVALLLARQMIRQRAASPLGRALVLRRRRLGLARVAQRADVRLDLLEGQRQLTRVARLRGAAELQALQLGQIPAKLLDFLVALLQRRRQIAHHLLQKNRVRGKPIKVQAPAEQNGVETAYQRYAYADCGPGGSGFPHAGQAASTRGARTMNVMLAVSLRMPSTFRPAGARQ